MHGGEGRRWTRRGDAPLVFLALLALAPVSAEAAVRSARLRWQPSPSAGVTGYRVYSRIPLGTFGAPIDAGLPTVAADGTMSFVVNGLDTLTTFLFAVSAYGTNGEGPRSNEIMLPPLSTTTTLPTSSTTTTLPTSSTTTTPPSSSTSTTLPASSTTTSQPPGTVTTTSSITTSTQPVFSTTSTTLGPFSGLVAAYGFDETGGATVGDGSGNGNTGSVSGAFHTLGGHTRTLYFDGVDDFVAVADAPELDLRSALTLEAWVYPTALGWYRVVIDKTTTGDPTNYFLGLLDDEVVFGFMAFGLWNEHVTDGVAMRLNSWTHIAATYSEADGEVTIVVNGELRLVEPEYDRPLINSQELRIGTGFEGENFAGGIEDVRIYGRALTQSEIRADMGRAVGPAPVTAPILTGQDGTLGAGDFCEGSSVGRDLAVTRLVERPIAQGTRLIFSGSIPTKVAPTLAPVDVSMEFRAADGTRLHSLNVPAAAFRANRNGTVLRYRTDEAGAAETGVQRLLIRSRSDKFLLSAKGLGSELWRVPDGGLVTVSVRIGDECARALGLDCSAGGTTTCVAPPRAPHR